MIERLQITHLRNLNHVNMQAAACNVIIGANGSGKTSLLEAIFLLSRGKSFRHSQPKRYVQHHQTAAIVHASLTDNSTLAIQKQSDATTVLRLNQTTVYNQSMLTERLPTLLIDPSTMDMLEQGSASRRQLLDWLVFHMKQGFHPQWVAYQRLLKQRNSLLKQTKHLTSAQLAELRAWDKGLANHAALIHHYRAQVFAAWQSHFTQALGQLLPQYAQQLTLTYSAGYDTNVPLDEQLSDRLAQDLQLGYTRIGSHRADVHVHWYSEESPLSNESSRNDAPHFDTNKNSSSKKMSEEEVDISIQAKRSILKEQAANVLSRGEKKLLITALRLSQLPLLLQDSTMLNNEHEVNGAPVLCDRTDSNATPVVLLDDITAELDDRAIQILLLTLSRLPCQVMMTTLTPEVLPLIHNYWATPNLFHMKQGQLTSF